MSLSINLLPTFILQNAQGDVYDYWIGYKDPESWLSIIGASLNDLTTLAEKRARFEQEPTLRDALILGHEAYGKRDRVASIRYYGAARRLDAEAAVAANLPYRLILSHLNCAEQGVYTRQQLSESISEILDSGDASPQVLLRVIPNIVATARHLGDAKFAVPYLERYHCGGKNTPRSRGCSGRCRPGGWSRAWCRWMGKLFISLTSSVAEASSASAASPSQTSSPLSPSWCATNDW